MEALGAGALVECVDDRPAMFGLPTPLRLGAVYSVAGVHPHAGHPMKCFFCGSREDGWSYTLTGVFEDQGGYCAKRFRPVHRPAGEAQRWVCQDIGAPLATPEMEPA